MTDFFSSPTANFIYFLIVGYVIVYLILRYDKNNRKNISKVMEQAKDVQPMLMKKAAGYKLHAIKAVCKNPNAEHTVIEQQLDELVKEYDNGRISFSDYCKSLNRLVAMMDNAGTASFK